MATEEAFLPLDSQIYISAVKAQKLFTEHKDSRSVLGRRYDEATTQSKPHMASHMIKRARRCGIEADYVIADAWFGTKSMMRTALELEMCAILRMKKNKMKYRAVVRGCKKELLNANELYARLVKRQWRKVRGLPWKAVALDVEIDLAEDDEKVPRWQAVRLLFVRGLKEPSDAEAGNKNWALFLTTDVRLSMSKMLEIYALRWGIGVSGEGHINQSVKVRPRSKDSGLVAWEAPWRESKAVEPSDPYTLGVPQRTRLQRAVNVEVASSHAFPVAETVYNARKQQGLIETSPKRQLSPAGYQRRHGAKVCVSTGETLGARRRKLVEEAYPITVSGKWMGRHQGGGSGCNTVDRRATKRAGREGPGPVGISLVQGEAGAR